MICPESTVKLSSDPAPRAARSTDRDGMRRLSPRCGDQQLTINRNVIYVNREIDCNEKKPERRSVERIPAATSAKQQPVIRRDGLV